MRSLAHELQHHTQKCNGDFENVQNMGEEGYAQADPHMRTMEIQAYQASIVFRDWEDSTKGTIYYEHLQKGDNVSMSTKNWKNGELKSLLSEAWGFKMDLSKLNENVKEGLADAKSGTGPRRYKARGKAGGPDDCDPDKDATCPPEPSEDAVEASIADQMKKEGLDEDLDGLADAIAEKLEVDLGAELTGWSGNSADYMEHEMEREMAHRRSTDIQKDLEILKKAQEELVFENKQLQEQNKQYKQATNELKESLQDVNLSNARLLYTNRVLRNTSLNERQKETIVEAISRAGSVTEARMILDTLQSTAQSTPQRGPQSLSEALNRRSSSSVIRASRQEKTDADPFSDRMKRLAGIK
jgi:hypothetical protein